jgi:hypothetical protein
MSPGCEAQGNEKQPSSLDYPGKHKLRTEKGKLMFQLKLLMLANGHQGRFIVLLELDLPSPLMVSEVLTYSLTVNPTPQQPSIIPIQ